MVGRSRAEGADRAKVSRLRKRCVAVAVECHWNTKLRQPSPTGHQSFHQSVDEPYAARKPIAPPEPRSTDDRHFWNFRGRLGDLASRNVGRGFCPCGGGKLSVPSKASHLRIHNDAVRPYNLSGAGGLVNLLAI